MIKVLIADDQDLIRQSLKIVLSHIKDMEVTGTAENGFEVIRSIREKKPDIILMDIRMPSMDGVRCTEIVKENYPDIKIIMLTTFDDDEYILSALKYGASGYLLKGVSMDELAKAIRSVNDGNAMLNPNVLSKVVRMFSKMAQSNFAIKVDNEQADLLSNSEWRIVAEVGKGLSNKEIAAKLHLSEGSVRNYLSSILRKLSFRDRTQVAIWAVQTNTVNRTFED